MRALDDAARAGVFAGDVARNAVRRCNAIASEGQRAAFLLRCGRWWSSFALSLGVVLQACLGWIGVLKRASDSCRDTTGGYPACPANLWPLALSLCFLSLFALSSRRMCSLACASSAMARTGAKGKRTKQDTAEFGEKVGYCVNHRGKLPRREARGPVEGGGLYGSL